MRLTDFTYTTAGDYILFSQNATQDPDTLKWARHDVSKDAYLIEFYDSNTDEGYIAFKRADAGTGYITWTEILRVNHDYTVVLPALSTSIAAAAVDQLKFFAKDYSGRTTLAKRDNTDESYVLEGKGMSRVWRQDTQPTGAKLWDVWIDTSGSGGGGGSGTYLGLSDTPGTFSGQAGLIPRVNDAENALEFTADCPEYKRIVALTNSEGDLHLSDGTNWNTSKALIKTIKVETSSTDWDLYLLQNDNGYATDDATIPMRQLNDGGNGDEEMTLDYTYEDEDDTSEVHLYWLDNSGTNTADIYIQGYALT
jgi:hypothetical protein